MKWPLANFTEYIPFDCFAANLGLVTAEVTNLIRLTSLPYVGAVNHERWQLYTTPVTRVQMWRDNETHDLIMIMINSYKLVFSSWKV